MLVFSCDPEKAAPPNGKTTAQAGKAALIAEQTYYRWLKDMGVTVDLIDPAARYGLHIRGLSGKIKTIPVYASPAKPFVAIEEQFNFADLFNSAWGKLDTGMVTVDPGQSVNLDRAS